MNSLNDPEFRHEYVNSFQDSKLAAQIVAFRKATGMTQSQLAERLDTAQSRVSAIESGDYSSWSLPTLRKLAAVFDVALAVEFVSFEDVVGRIEQSGAHDFEIRPGYGTSVRPTAARRKPSSRPGEASRSRGVSRSERPARGKADIKNIPTPASPK
jgi:transcriptional regulator with XRE-family HTH domain